MDRLTSAIQRVIVALMPDASAITMYRARVVKQSSDLRKVDVQPDDPRIAGLQEVPLQLGMPGVTVQLSPGAYVLLGFRNGDRQYPFAALFEGGESVVKTVVESQLIELGGSGLGTAPLMNGVVVGSMPCPFAGATHGAMGGCSTVVMAKKA